MSLKMSEDASGIFNCSICLEHFKKPKLLPCQHTFCENCLDAYIQSSTGGGDGTLSSKWFLCPLCRQTVKPPDVNSKPREWASLLPINSMITSMMQTSEKGMTDNKTNENRNCGPCQRDEEISTGLFWCPNCLEFLCENCKKFHKRIKASEMHKIIPVEEMDNEHTGSQQTKVTEIDEPCPDHVGENLKVFCMTHKTMCCVMCLAIHHNECKEIKTLEEMSEQMEGDQSGAKFIDCLDDMKTRLGETIKDREENIEHLNQRRKFVVGQMKVFVEQAKSNLDSFFKDFESQMTSLNEKHRETISETKQKIECLLKTLEYGEQMLKYLSRNGHPKQLFIAIEKFKVQILNHLQQLKMDSEDDKMVDYYFTVDEIFLKLKNPKPELKLAQVQPKYDICKKPVTPIITELSLISDQEIQKQRQLLKADVSKIEAVKIWDARINGRISSGVFLDSRTLICCDSSNRNLLAYDNNGTLLCQLKLDYHPISLDIAFEKEILVLGFMRKQISTYIFKQKQFHKLQEIEIPYYSKGMVIVGNKIVITNGKNIDVMTVFGSKLQTLTVEDFSSDDHCFMATDHSSVYYSYKGSLQEISFNKNGVGKASFKLPKQFEGTSSEGIAIDQYGNKFICVFDTNYICVLSKDCQKHCMLKTNVKTFVIGFEKNGSRFFVTDINRGDENVMLEVYEVHLKTGC